MGELKQMYRTVVDDRFPGSMIIQFDNQTEKAWRRLNIALLLRIKSCYRLKK